MTMLFGLVRRLLRMFATVVAVVSSSAAQEESERTGGASKSLRGRIETFERWLRATGPELVEDHADGGLDREHVEELGRQTDLLGCHGWQMRPGREESRTGLVLAPEGDSTIRFVTELAVRWVEVEGWDLFPSMPPAPAEALSEFRMKLGVGSWLWFRDATVSISERGAGGAVDIVVRHPEFADIEAAERGRLVFLMLDHAIGEDAVAAGVGAIETSSEQDPEAVPLLELGARMRAVRGETASDRGGGWWPRFTVYEVPESQRRASFRRDAMFGATTSQSLIEPFTRWDNDPFVEHGACLASLALPRSALPTDTDVASRGRWEDRIDASFAAKRCGMVVGGGTAPDRVYIDLLLADFDLALATLRETLGQHAELAGASLGVVGGSTRYRVVDKLDGGRDGELGDGSGPRGDRSDRGR